MQATSHQRRDGLPLQAAMSVGRRGPHDLQLQGCGKPDTGRRVLPHLPRDERKPQRACVARGDQRWAWGDKTGLLQCSRKVSSSVDHFTQGFIQDFSVGGDDVCGATLPRACEGMLPQEIFEI